jgi:septum formation protein
VTFKALNDTDIDIYIDKVQTLDKAGAYSVQDHTDLIIAGYKGSFTNIMGLPLEETKQILTQCGLRV